MNQGIYNKFKSPHAVTILKVHRLEWLGHVVRMVGERPVKKLLEGKPQGGSKKGRPGLRRMDELHLSLQKPRPNLKCCSAKEGEEEEEEVGNL